MPPLASSGPIYIGGVVSLALLFAWWLLRAEAREAANEAGAASAGESHDPPSREVDADRVSAP